MKYIYAAPDNKFSSRLTIFAIPKRFEGHIGIIQRNAITSWTLLHPRPEIVLYGDEPGIAEICAELNLIWVGQTQCNQYGTPLLDEIFSDIRDRARGKIIAYLNGDIILQQDFLWGIQAVERQLKDYLIIGRRWNLDLEIPLKFDSDWQSSLNQAIAQQGSLADCDCKDYFVFPQHLFATIPPFAVGRGYWDTWMVRNALAENIAVVDASEIVTAAHQNHTYNHIRGGKNEAYLGKEAQINKTLGNLTQPGDIACATWQLKPIEAKDAPAVSVIIIVRAEERDIERSLLSVLIQDLNLETIVISTGFNRELPNIINTYRSEIQYHQSEDVYTAIVDGCQLAKGEFIFFLEADRILRPGVLIEQLAYFEQHASTLDILLSGSKVIQGNKIQEYQPQEKIGDREYLQPEKFSLLQDLPVEHYGIMLRRDRLKMINHSLRKNERSWQQQILHYLVKRRVKAEITNLISLLWDTGGK